ncbi:MAG: sensor histidine kinase [Actinomycetota bacterium]|nr:sensor histidine kinase [Actinomycetota bacterium]
MPSRRETHAREDGAAASPDPGAAPDHAGPAARDGYVPLFWRLFIPNATVLTVAGIILTIQPANGRIPALAGGLAVMLAVNMVIMRRTAGPLARLAGLMSEIDPLYPGERIPSMGPPSEVTLVTTAFNDMLDRIERERRESARREAAAEQTERRHVAAELHDQIGQTLTGMVFALNRVLERAPEDLRPELERVQEMASETIDDVRRLAARLRPEVLDTLGLVAALTNLCERVSERTGLRVIPRMRHDLAVLSPEAQLVAYRVAQESLTNVARHAAGSQATVELLPDGDDVLLRVTDDGVGLDPASPQGGGIRGMRERALLIGGELRLVSLPAGGVQLTLRIPAAETVR